MHTLEVALKMSSWLMTLSGFWLLAATWPWSASKRLRASVTGSWATVIVEVCAWAMADVPHSAYSFE